eukprot:270632_1
MPRFLRTSPIQNDNIPRRYKRRYGAERTERSQHIRITTYSLMHTAPIILSCKYTGQSSHYLPLFTVRESEIWRFNEPSATTSSLHAHTIHHGEPMDTGHATISVFAMYLKSLTMKTIHRQSDIDRNIYWTNASFMADAIVAVTDSHYCSRRIASIDI